MKLIRSRNCQAVILVIIGKITLSQENKLLSFGRCKLIPKWKNMLDRDLNVDLRDYTQQTDNNNYKSS